MERMGDSPLGFSGGKARLGSTSSLKKKTDGRLPRRAWPEFCRRNLAGLRAGLFQVCQKSVVRPSAQRVEARAKLVREGLRLLPGGEMAALGQPVVVDQLGIGLLGPALRRGVDLVRKGADRRRQRDALGREEGELALPVEPRRRDRRVGQPVERDVVEDVVAASGPSAGPSKTRAISVVAAVVVVEHPGGEADRRIRQRVERLRPVRHLVGVAQAVLVEEVELVPGILLVGREAGGCRPVRQAPSRSSAGTVAGMLVWMPIKPGRLLQRHLLGDRIAPVAALRDVARVAEALISIAQARAMRCGSQPVCGRLAREAVAGQRRDHDVEGVGGAAAVGGRIGQRAR